MDELGSRLTKLFAFLRERGVRVVEGYLSDGSQVPTISLKEDPEDSVCDDFGEAAVAMKATFVVAHVERLDQENLDKAIDRVRSSQSVDTEDRKGLLAELERCRRYMGHVCAAQLSYFTVSPLMEFRLEQYSPWNELVYGEPEETDDEDSDVDEPPSDEDIESLARRLANDPRFHRATNEPTREIVARRVLGKEAPGRGAHLQEIIFEAKGIFESEVKPAQEQTLRDKATKLIREGKSRSAVATNLGITNQKLSQLLE